MNDWISIVRARMEELGITQEQMAERIEVTQGAVGHWLTGRREPKLADINRLLKEVGLPPLSVQTKSEQSLSTGDQRNSYSASSNVQPMPQPERYYRYPVLTRVAAGAFAAAVQPYAPGAEDQWEYSDYKAAGQAFWFEVKGHSMTSHAPPSFPPGVLVLIDTGLEPQPGDFVLATIPDEEEATFKQLIREDGQLYLKPLNPDYRTMPVAEGCRLIGKAKEAKFKL